MSRRHHRKYLRYVASVHFQNETGKGQLLQCQKSGEPAVCLIYDRKAKLLTDF
jgi:hypothetical protein